LTSPLFEMADITASTETKVAPGLDSTVI